MSLDKEIFFSSWWARLFSQSSTEDFLEVLTKENESTAVTPFTFPRCSAFMIQIDASPQPPSIHIYGGERTGDAITVACSTFHTCPYRKPDIFLNGTEGSDQLHNEHIEDGLWKVTLTRTGVVKAENITMNCSVTHHGGLIVTTTNDKSAKCVPDKITIEPELAEVTDGVAKNFTCSVYHSCKRETPTITWNYENMTVSDDSNKLPGLNQVSYSTITFLGSKDDHGMKLICTAKISGKAITASVVLHLQSPFINEPLLTELKTIGLYILAPSLVFLLACLIAGVIIFKRRQRSKDACTVSGNKPFSKPRMPSPKSDPKSCNKYDCEAEYTNMEDLNMYGNI
ncbi:myeloid cell surface antigen CD33-like [Pimephales promelas]|nr:myeloid cell surface antigen CD33-like [Pimephales promelas]